MNRFRHLALVLAVLGILAPAFGQIDPRRDRKDVRDPNAVERDSRRPGERDVRPGERDVRPGEKDRRPGEEKRPGEETQRPNEERRPLEQARPAEEGRPAEQAESEAAKRERLQEVRERRARELSQAKVDEIRSQTREQRELALGTDPATKDFRANEGRVGAEIEAKYGYFERSKSPGAEWVSVSGPYEGKSFDLTGPPERASRFQDPDMASFRKNFDKDLSKADYTVLETREMTPEQKAKVLEHVNAKDRATRDRVIILE